MDLTHPLRVPQADLTNATLSRKKVAAKRGHHNNIHNASLVKICGEPEEYGKADTLSRKKSRPKLRPTCLEQKTQPEKP